jgi:hypothetical protein
VGIRVKTHLPTPTAAQVVLCSSALELPDAQRQDDDGRRCPIACTCRDATQDWGLEACMHVTDTAVTNAAHLSVCMGKVASRCLRECRQRDPACRRLDLKARCRADTDVTETLTRLPETPAPGLWAQIFTTVAGIGRLHAVQSAFSPRSLAKGLC